MRLEKLNRQQYIGWAITSFTYGISLLIVAYINRDDFALGSDDTIFSPSNFALLVFGISWLVGVLGARFYIQDKDPNDFFSLIGIKKQR
jgi:uncharacterized membrane protein